LKVYFSNDSHRYKLGDHHDEITTTGPVISQAAVRKIKEHVDDALAKGATDSTPENSSFLLAKASSNQKGNYVAPIVLTNVNHEMLTLKEETFGPVMPIMKVASDNEAVALMNDSDYGLTASVWTKDIAVGEELIDRIEAGTVFINRCDYPSPVRDIIIHYNYCLKLTFYKIGSCLDRLEDIRFGMYPRAAGI
jgi:acyl-CoA reductase-like NAD-dependent aldehyde dehydrogenase